MPVAFSSLSRRCRFFIAGFGHIPVYRCDERKIGCSLAESAEQLGYGAWLTKAAEHENPLHVIYINTR